MATAAFTPESVARTERTFVGSLPATESRPVGQFHLLAGVEFDLSWLTDPLASAIYKACQIHVTDGLYKGLVPDAETIANIIYDKNLMEPSEPLTDDASRIEYLTQLKSDIELCVQQGRDGKKWLKAITAHLKDLHRERKASALGDAISETLKGNIGTVRQRLAEAGRLLDENMIAPDGDQIITGDDLAEALVKLYKESVSRVTSKDIPLMLPVEFGELRERVGQLRPGVLHVVSGLTSTGKSSIMLQMAMGIAQEIQKKSDGTRPVIAYFHLEDNHNRILERMTAHLTGAAIQALQRGDPQKKFLEAAKIVANWPGSLHLIHCPGASAEWIQAQVSMMNPAIVFIDYIQKVDTMAAQSRGIIKANAISDNMETFKRMAENPAYTCPVFIGSQEADPSSSGSTQQRTGTSESRDIERKSQVLIRIVPTRLGPSDAPLVIDDLKLTDPNQYTPHMRLVIEKNSDGMRGDTVGLFTQTDFMFEALTYLKWKDANPGKPYPKHLSYQVPDKQFLDHHDAKRKAIKKAYLVMPQFTGKKDEPPKNASKAGTKPAAKSGKGKSSSNGTSYAEKDNFSKSDGGTVTSQYADDDNAGEIPF